MSNRILQALYEHRFENGPWREPYDMDAERAQRSSLTRRRVKTSSDEWLVRHKLDQVTEDWFLAAAKYFWWYP